MPIYNFLNLEIAMMKVKELAFIHALAGAILLRGVGNLPDHYVWRTLAFFCICVHMATAFGGGIYYRHADHLGDAEWVCAGMWAMMVFLFGAETVGAIAATFWFAFEDGLNRVLTVAVLCAVLCVGLVFISRCLSYPIAQSSPNSSNPPSPKEA